MTPADRHTPACRCEVITHDRIRFCPVHAAAPELQEALREALSYIRTCAEREIVPSADGQGFRDALAAIAKAEGRAK